MNTKRAVEQTQGAPDVQEQARRKNAVRIALVTGILMTLITAVTLPIAFQIGMERIWGPIITAITALVAFASAFISSRNRPTLGSGILISVILFLGIFVTFLFANNQGIAMAAIVIFLVSTIASVTLPPAWIARVMTLSIVLGLANILADFYLPNFGLPSDPRYTNIIAIILSAIYIFITLRRFNQYSLRTKLVLLFILVAIFSVGAIAIVTNNLARTEITQQVGRNQQILAERLAFETGQELESQIESLQSVGSQFGEIADSANNSFVGTDSGIISQILVIDKRWQTAPDNDIVVLGVLNNDIASKLRDFQSKFPDHVELFLTNKYGANIAATNRSSDYYQADEDWWKKAYSLGKGKVYIGQPEFDESSQTYSINLAVPISYKGKVAGILRSTYDVSALVKNFQQGAMSTAAAIDLRIQNDTLLNGKLLSQDELPGLTKAMGSYQEVTYQGAPSLISQQRVFSSTNSSAQAAVSELGWSIIVHQDVAEALQPVQQQTQAITLVSILVIILVSLLGLLASQRLAAPIITLTAITNKVAEGDLAIRANISTQDEIGALANTFNRMTSQLQDTLGGLERRIAERTADVELARLLSERRAQDLQAISEVSRTISTEQRLGILLPLVTRLVSERFDFYHVGIFFVDATKQFAILQASNSEGGKRMLERGHRLEVGLTGIVGAVAQTGQPRIALDVGSDAAFFDNPDLPTTRSEMALPLNFRGETIGVLDVQSVKPGAFTESDANTLSILADQVAIAIENARLISQTQQARDEAEALYNQFQQVEWKNFAQQESAIGYSQSAISGKPLTKLVETAEIREALQKGQVVVFDDNSAKALPSISLPVKLRGQTIGVLNIKAPTKHRKWNQDEINLAQAVSDRLALALDNARLLQESQRRASKEAKIGEVTAKIGASINMRNVLQTAVEELGRALPGSEVVIQFESSEEN
ncbi:MAG: GAF domain-containing protein [Chloroflexota bacterium]